MKRNFPSWNDAVPSYAVPGAVGLAILMVFGIRELRWREDRAEYEGELARVSWHANQQKVAHFGALAAGDSLPNVSVFEADRPTQSLSQLVAAGRSRLVIWSSRCGTCAMLDHALRAAVPERIRAQTVVLVPTDTPDSTRDRLSRLGRVYSLPPSAIVRQKLPLTPAVVTVNPGMTVTSVAHGQMFRVGQVLADLGLADQGVVDSLRSTVKRTVAAKKYSSR